VVAGGMLVGVCEREGDELVAVDWDWGWDGEGEETGM